MAEHDEQVKNQIRSFLYQMLAPLRTWLAGGFDHFGGFLHDLFADLGYAFFKEAGHITFLATHSLVTALGDHGFNSGENGFLRHACGSEVVKRFATRWI